MLNDLLLEIGTEELPSAAVYPLAEALANEISSALKQAKIAYGKVRFYATPRRLAVLIHEVATQQESQRISKRGPAIHGETAEKPSAAVVGFAKSCGVPVKALTTLKTDKGIWWAFEQTQTGQPTVDILPELIDRSIAKLPLTKPMRWGSGDIQFVRPVHWVVLLFGDQVVPCEILGVKTGRNSYGHRFHHPEAITIGSPREYKSALDKGFVIANFATRREMIVKQIEALALEHQCEAVMPEWLINEVTAIVEWPQALWAHFEAAYLEVPAEALIAAMQVHQKCFALRDKQNQDLLPNFITVANIVSRHPEEVVLGNENVMRARLSDAVFFFRQDQRQTLFSYRAATAQVVFQAQLGSLLNKMERLENLMEHMVALLKLDSEEARRAAALSKCDLMTGMVGEFPELQGLMGYYYALHDGEPLAVAKALNEQYMPRFAGDVLPDSMLGLALSFADRLDTLVGAFALGQKPTGMKDPFKLRRQALAIVRLLMKIEAPLSLSQLLSFAWDAYGDRFTAKEEVLGDLKYFILERLYAFYEAQGITQDRVQAVRAREDDWLYDLDKRLQALLHFTQLPEALHLSATCKRVKHLLDQVETTPQWSVIDEGLLKEPAEKALYQHLQQVEHDIAALYRRGNYDSILNLLATFREPLDTFFNEVMVMVPDVALRENRVHMLQQLQALLQGVADISLLQLEAP